MAGRSTITITCVCCGESGLHQARGLRESCYARHQAAGRLDKFPLTRKAKTPWTPVGQHGARRLARYAQLAARSLPLTVIAVQMDVSVRSVQRYAAAHAARQEVTT